MNCKTCNVELTEINTEVKNSKIYCDRCIKVKDLNRMYIKLYWGGEYDYYKNIARCFVNVVEHTGFIYRWLNKEKINGYIWEIQEIKDNSLFTILESLKIRKCDITITRNGIVHEGYQNKDELGGFVIHNLQRIKPEQNIIEHAVATHIKASMHYLFSKNNPRKNPTGWVMENKAIRIFSNIETQKPEYCISLNFDNKHQAVGFADRKTSLKSAKEYIKEIDKLSDNDQRFGGAEFYFEINENGWDFKGGASVEELIGFIYGYMIIQSVKEDLINKIGEIYGKV